MTQYALPQKAIHLASDFVEAPDQFVLLEIGIKRFSERLKIIWGDKVLNSLFGHFYVLWSQPLK